MHNGKRELIEFSTPIQHVIVIYLENRTPEDLFGAYWRVINPTTGNTFGTDLDLIDPSSLTPPLSPHPLDFFGNPNHDHSPGFMDDATGVWPTGDPNKSGYWYVPTPNPITPATPSVSQYISIIENWAYANHTLQSNEGPSFEAHQYLISGQSGGLPDSSIYPQGMANNPRPGGNPPPGNGTCYSTPQNVDTVNMYSPYPTPSPSIAPACNEYPSIVDFMASAAPLASPYYQWQYIAFNRKSIWAAPMAITHLYNAYSADPNPDKTGQPFAIDPDAENFVLNLGGTTETPNPRRPFALLTYITPCMGESDHPNSLAPGTDMGFDDAPQWLSYVLNAVGESTFWDNTAVIVSWDDWGGFYDNYSPQPWPFHPTPNPYGAPTGNPADPNEWGFRVPLMVLSPYIASRGTIDPNPMSQGAILNFVETIFSLTPHALGGDDYTNQGEDLTEMFNFNAATPLPWITLSSTFTPQHGDCPTATPSPTPPP
jgi:phospholipase C